MILFFLGLCSGLLLAIFSFFAVIFYVAIRTPEEEKALDIARARLFNGD